MTTSSKSISSISQDSYDNTRGDIKQDEIKCDTCGHEPRAQYRSRPIWLDLKRITSSAICLRCKIVIAGVQQFHNSRGIAGFTSSSEKNAIGIHSSHVEVCIYEGDSRRGISTRKKLSMLEFYTPFNAAEANVEKLTRLERLEKGRAPLPTNNPFVFGSHVSSKIDIETAVAVITPWLTRCSTDTVAHPECNPQKVGHLPKRLLDLSLCTSKGTIALVHTSEIITSERLSYVTLSHCWGLSSVIQTTNENVEQHFRSIPLSDLPPTFEHAVLLTAAIGIRYIWIDSLCIIQKDRLDWEQQGSIMNDIYESSYLNIAASYASGSQGGLFNPRSDNGISVEGLPVTNELDLSTYEWGGQPVFVRPDLNDTHKAHLQTRTIPNEEDDDDTYVSSVPLLSRAWVYQERSLSPRTVNFYESEMIWECRTASICECGHFDKQHYEPTSLKHITVDYTTSAPLESSSTSTTQPNLLYLIEKSWLRHITTFATLSLTNITDRLPAISGIASRTASILTEALPQNKQPLYLAGIWDVGDPIIKAWQLCWQPYKTTESWKPSATLKRAEPYVAPTWSWASIDFEQGVSNSFLIHWPDLSDDWVLMLEFDDSDCNVEGVNPYGVVSSGYLKVKGRLARALDAKDVSRRREIPVGQDTGGLVRYFDSNLDLDGWQEVYEQGETYVMPVTRTDYSSDYRYVALILQRHDQEDGAEEKIYIRIGVLHSNYNFRPVSTFEDPELISIIIQ